MKILLSQGFGGLIPTDDFSKELRKRFNTSSMYILWCNKNAIALVEEWASKGKKPFDGGYVIEELNPGEKYYIQDDEGYETLVTEDDIEWEVAE